MLGIVTTPNPVLSKTAEVYVFKKNGLDEEGKKLIEEMKKTLLSAKDPEGVGLAAPQVGKSLQIFIVKETHKSPFLTFINPKILEVIEDPTDKKRNKKKDNKLEGCLSLPNIWGFVKRYPKVRVSYYDEQEKFREKTFSGFLATIIQHEVDHLNGILFPKHVLEQKSKLYKSRKNQKGEDEFEEIEL